MNEGRKERREIGEGEEEGKKEKQQVLSLPPWPDASIFFLIFQGQSASLPPPSPL